MSTSVASERAAWTAGIATLWAVGYFGLGVREPLRHQVELTTPIDWWIPFVGWTIWVYFFGIALALAPLAAV